MKSSLVFLFSALSLSSATAAAPDPVVGSWRALPVQSAMSTARVIGIPQLLTFTDDGHLWTSQQLDGRAPPNAYLLGRYTVDGARVVAKGPSGETYGYELMKDGRLCIYPGPGMMPVAGLARPQEAGRQCYERLQKPV
jgi:hypothetical protein